MFIGASHSQHAPQDRRREPFEGSGNARQDDSADLDGILRFLRQPLGLLRQRIDDEAYDRGRLVRKRHQSEAADLDAPGDRRDGARDEAPGTALEPHAVVAHETRKAAPPAVATSSRASRDLPLPDGPRIRTPASPMRTQLAWTVALMPGALRAAGR